MGRRLDEAEDDINGLELRVASLEARISQHNEKRDGEIALLKTAHEVSTFWRCRCEGMERERDEYKKRATDLDAQLARVAAVREAKPETSWEIARREARERFTARAKEEAERKAQEDALTKHRTEVYSAFRKSSFKQPAKKAAKKRKARSKT